MDTKLKNTSKLMLFLLMVAILATAVVSVFSMAELEIPPGDALTSDSYLESGVALSRFRDEIYNLSTLGTTYISEENVRSGDWIKLDFYDLHYTQRQVYEQFNGQYDGERLVDDFRDDPLVMAAFIEKYPVLVEDIINHKIVSQMIHYQEAIDQLAVPGLKYYFHNDKVTFENTDMDRHAFKQMPMYFVFDQKGMASSVRTINLYLNDKLMLERDKLYIGFTEEYLQAQGKIWQDQRTDMQLYLLCFVLSSVAAILLFYILASQCHKLKWVIADWYLEIILALAGTLIGLSTTLVAFSSVYPPLWVVWTYAILLSLFVTYGLLQVIKHWQLYRLRKNFVYTFFSWILRGISRIITVMPFAVRMLPNHRNAVDFKRAHQMLNAIEAGNMAITVSPESEGLYGQLIHRINKVRDGLEQAVYNELKSERMKSELISNVSHDIRTPMTSIVTYLDLLQKTDSPEERDQYLAVLNKKVGRLNLLIDDLFDAAKIASGDITMDLETVDLKQVIHQVLGEHGDQLAAKELHVLETIDNLYVQADRKSIWRVVDNLIINIIKYSLPGSRVYIDGELQDEIQQVVFRNISEHPLNISAEELKLRFKRGDASRTTEGSGLGLAIAEDLMSLQNGQLKLSIDGDLFKVVLKLKASKDPAEQAAIQPSDDN